MPDSEAESASATEPDLTFLDLAELVLSQTQRPMTYREIWNHGVAQGLVARVGSRGVTPWITLSAVLGTDVRKNPASKFARTNLFPTTYYLKALPPPATAPSPPTREAAEAEREEVVERDLHPLVAFFARTQLHAYVKTIFHERSSKRGYLRWAHPDLVGFYHPEDDWEDEVVDLGTTIGQTPIEFLSFEVKIRLDFDNLGSAFFEAVSNSSWANRGYLAVAEIDEDDEFLEELSRLVNAHGIGVIQLDRQNPEKSRITIEARRRERLDWATVNKLYDVNPNFEEFMDAVNRVAKGGRIRPSDFDAIRTVSELTGARIAPAGS